MIDDYDESSGWMFLLVPAHPGFPGQIPQSRKTVVCVCVCFILIYVKNNCILMYFIFVLDIQNNHGSGSLSVSSI